MLDRKKSGFSTALGFAAGDPSRTRLVLAAALLLSSGVAHGQAFSPGKLARPHAHLDTRCQQCHEGGKVSDARCLACHVALRARVRVRRGFHGRLARSRCGSCHTDHRGRGHPLIRWPGGKPKLFDHGGTGYPLVAKHRGLACRKCHNPKLQVARTLPRFSAARRRRTFLGMPRACGGCHADPHDRKLGGLCQACHSVRGFKPVRSFPDHRRTRYPLDGAHVKVACKGCHQPKGVSKVEGWVFRPLRFDDCKGCHASPHRGTMTQGLRPRGRLACGTCHITRAWRAVRYRKRRHPRAFPLTGGHAKPACRACHGKKGNRRPPAATTTCASCHRDPHEGRFGRRCRSCHTIASWHTRRGEARRGHVSLSKRQAAARIGITAAQISAVAFHDKTRFELTGRHIAVRCAACHVGRTRRLRHRRFARCADCHTDVHRGQFARLARARGATPPTCEGCHTTDGWGLTRFDAARHARTRFPLRGAHAAVACRACHGPKRAAARRYVYRRRTCDACHRDAHRGRYRLRAADRRPMPCATCHGERSFHAIRFDHGKTRFALTGKHARAACADCHRPGPRGVTAFRAASRRCGSCHRDQHQGQFLSAPTRDCAACHSTSGFAVGRFDHRRRTRFPLRGAHARLACKACHPVVRLKGGARTTLYRLASRACASCHRSRHENIEERLGRRLAPAVRLASVARPQLPTRLLARCEACHVERDWDQLKTISGFDHASVGYPLVGRHAAARCGDCHRAGRRAGRACSACHADPHAGKLSARCQECHRPVSWRVPDIIARHRRTRLPLTGMHALADCASCHPRARTLGFRGVPAACYACHTAAYLAPETHPDHRKSGFGTRCEQCHRPIGWTPAAFASRSAALTAHRRFRLTGRHAALRCADCHGRGRPSPRCATCHATARRVARAPSHATPAFTACGRCHTPRAWRPARFAGHAARFPLVGRHAGLPCTTCHTDERRLASVTCAGLCHRDARRRHARVAGFSPAAAACRRCHPLGRR